MSGKTEIEIRCARYMNRGETRVSVPAKVVGDLAIHRRAVLHEDEETVVYLNEWTVTHIQTGDSVRTACPFRWFKRGRFTASQRDLVKWAAAFQDAAPEFFAAARVQDKAGMLKHVHAAMDAGQSL